MNTRFGPHLFSIAALLTLILANSPAFADNYGMKHHNFYQRHYDEDNHNYNNDRYDSVGINARDRSYLLEYLRRDGSFYPPHRQFRKRYDIGYPLPHYVRPYALPAYVTRRLRPLPYGYQYVRIDRDVVLVDNFSGQVIDIVSPLPGLGRR